MVYFSSGGIIQLNVPKFIFSHEMSQIKKSAETFFRRSINEGLWFNLAHLQAVRFLDVEGRTKGRFILKDVYYSLKSFHEGNDFRSKNQSLIWYIVLLTKFRRIHTIFKGINFMQKLFGLTFIKPQYVYCE